MKGRAKALAEQGHRVNLIYQPYKDYAVRKPCKFWKDENLTQRNIYSSFFRSPFLLKPFFLIPLLLFDIPRIFLLMRTSGITILHKPLPLSLFYLVLLKGSFYGGKIILILDDWEGVGGFASIRNAENIKNKLLVTFCEEYTPDLADGVLCVSEILYKKMTLSKKTKDKAIYLPNGSNAEPKTEAFIPKTSQNLKIGYVGTFKNRPLIDFLLEIVETVIKKDKNVSFAFIGGGYEHDYMKEKIAKKGLASYITLTGQIPRVEVDKVIEDIPVCLLILSDAYPETYIDKSRSSTKLFEYMAAGKIIVSSDFGEPVSILKDGKTGYLVGNTADAFAEKISDIKTNLTECALLGSAAIKDFKENYSHTILMQKMMSWIKKGL